MILREYQANLAGETQLQWALGHKVVLTQLETGGGKTAIISHIVNEHAGFVCVLAHRDKLVEQISLTLARGGIRHDLICSEKSKRLIAKKHVKKLGQCFYVPGARVRAASAQTLVKAKGLEKWAQQVTLWVVDESHHLLKENLWGRCLAHFTHPQCLGLMVTATPGRPDGKGLGRHKRGCNGGPCEGCNDGFADVMVEGPAMRWLIDEGYLCDYDVACPPSDMRINEAPKGADGEYTQDQRREAARNSHIVGDVPKHYLHFARGLSGITFCGDIETATSTVAEYRRLGVTAELITGNTDSTIRDQIFDRAEAGTLNQIVAVDVISEGVDIPALQVGSFARLTASIITWRQQLGRLLRPMATPQYLAATNREERLAAIAASAKPRALLIDHVDGFRNPNLGPPDRPRPWSLEPRDKRSKGQDDDDIPMRVCTNPDIVPTTGRRCFAPYPRTQRKCPKCQYEPQPQGRATPEQVDGDLQLMDPAALAELQGRVFDPTLDRLQFAAVQQAKGARSEWIGRHWTGYRATCDAQEALRATMDTWAGQLHAEGRADWEIQKAHYLTFGVDVLTAQSLQSNDAQALRERIDRAVQRSTNFNLCSN